MQTHIARQAIFDRSLRVAGYELLYRAGDSDGAVFENGDRATRALLSTALIEFGLRELTGGRRAYINFTEKLVMSDLMLALDPTQITVELLETIPVTERLVQRIQELKALGYRLALDDYTGGAEYDPVLPLVDVLKVDFLQTDRQAQARIADRCQRAGMKLLAEKIEDRESYDWALYNGYQLFQGYYFARPAAVRREGAKFNLAAYTRLLRELNRPDADLHTCTEIIRTDPMLTFRLLERMRTMRYYRGHSNWLLDQAVAYLGIDELHHWAALMMARDMNASMTDETVRSAYLRGIFVERLVENSPLRAEKLMGFLTGMFSLMDRIVGRPLKQLVEEVALPREVRDALLSRDGGRLRPYLTFAAAYETLRPEELPPLTIPAEEISALYMRCIQETDRAFSCGG